VPANRRLPLPHAGVPTDTAALIDDLGAALARLAEVNEDSFLLAFGQAFDTTQHLLEVRARAS
jgi:hypothetical protein